MPLVEWGDVADLETTSVARASNNFADVVDVSASSVLDADDPLRAVVSVDVRLRWLDAMPAAVERVVERVSVRTVGA